MRRPIVQTSPRSGEHSRYGLRPRAGRPGPRTAGSIRMGVTPKLTAAALFFLGRSTRGSAESEQRIVRTARPQHGRHCGEDDHEPCQQHRCRTGRAEIDGEDNGNSPRQQKAHQGHTAARTEEHTGKSIYGAPAGGRARSTCSASVDVAGHVSSLRAASRQVPRECAPSAHTPTGWRVRRAGLPGSFRQACGQGVGEDRRVLLSMDVRDRAPRRCFRVRASRGMGAVGTGDRRSRRRGGRRGELDGVTHRAHG